MTKEMDQKDRIFRFIHDSVVHGKEMITVQYLMLAYPELTCPEVQKYLYILIIMC